MDAFGLKCMGLKVSFILKLNCFCKNKFFVEIWNLLMLKLVNIRGDNNVQEKKNIEKIYLLNELEDPWMSLNDLNVLLCN